MNVYVVELVDDKGFSAVVSVCKSREGAEHKIEQLIDADPWVGLYDPNYKIMEYTLEDPEHEVYI